MCNCRSNIQTSTTSYIPVPVVVNTNCNTSQEFVLSLKQKIDNSLHIQGLSIKDFNLLQIYKGQVLSGINLNNLCYSNYSQVEDIVNNVISKYQ